MTTFTEGEVQFLQSRGNEVSCRPASMGLYVRQRERHHTVTRGREFKKVLVLPCSLQGLEVQES